MAIFHCYVSSPEGISIVHRAYSSPQAPYPPVDPGSWNPQIAILAVSQTQEQCHPGMLVECFIMFYPMQISYRPIIAGLQSWWIGFSTPNPSTPPIPRHPTPISNGHQLEANPQSIDT